MEVGLFYKLYKNIQLLTIEVLDMMWYRPEKTSTNRGEAEVNIGVLRSISHHIQCLNSQQLFYNITFRRKRANNSAPLFTMYEPTVIQLTSYESPLKEIYI